MEEGFTRARQQTETQPSLAWLMVFQKLSKRLKSHAGEAH